MAGRKGRGARAGSPQWEDNLAEVARALRRMGTSSSQQGSGGSRETPERVASREFRRYNPPQFDGESDPIA